MNIFAENSTVKTPLLKLLPGAWFTRDDGPGIQFIRTDETAGREHIKCVRIHDGYLLRILCDEIVVVSILSNHKKEEE